MGYYVDTEQGPVWIPEVPNDPEPGATPSTITVAPTTAAPAGGGGAVPNLPPGYN